MASTAESTPQARPASRPRDLAYRSSQDVSGPLTVILAVICFVLAASFLFSLDWQYSSDLPVVTETLPSQVPAALPSTPPSNS